MARDFNGSTDRLEYANVLNTIGAAQSLSMWIYLDTIATPYRYLFCVHNSANTAYATVLGLGYVNATTSRITLFSAGSTELSHSGQKTTSLITGAWHHLLYTWDGSTTAANSHIYFDGTEISYDDTTNGASLTAATGKWAIGARIYDDARNTDGRMAEVGFWNRVLSAGEIAALAKRFSPVTFPNSLVFCAPLLRGTADRYGKAATEDGTTVAAHLPMIYPQMTYTNAVYVAPSGPAKSQDYIFRQLLAGGVG